MTVSLLVSTYNWPRALYLCLDSVMQQTVLPDRDYNCLSQVTVAAIPTNYVDNAAGGQTLTVGG